MKNISTRFSLKLLALIFVLSQGLVYLNRSLADQVALGQSFGLNGVRDSNGKTRWRQLSARGLLVQDKASKALEQTDPNLQISNQSQEEHKSAMRLVVEGSQKMINELDAFLNDLDEASSEKKLSEAIFGTFEDSAKQISGRDIFMASLQPLLEYYAGLSPEQKIAYASYNDILGSDGSDGSVGSDGVILEYLRKFQRSQGADELHPKLQEGLKETIEFFEHWKQNTDGFVDFDDLNKDKDKDELKDKKVSRQKFLNKDLPELVKASVEKIGGTENMSFLKALWIRLKNFVLRKASGQAVSLKKSSISALRNFGKKVVKGLQDIKILDEVGEKKHLKNANDIVNRQKSEAEVENREMQKELDDLEKEADKDSDKATASSGQTIGVQTDFQFFQDLSELKKFANVVNKIISIDTNMSNEEVNNVYEEASKLFKGIKKEDLNVNIRDFKDLKDKFEDNDDFAGFVSLFGETVLGLNLDDGSYDDLQNRLRLIDSVLKSPNLYIEGSDNSLDTGFNSSFTGLLAGSVIVSGALDFSNKDLKFKKRVVSDVSDLATAIASSDYVDLAGASVDDLEKRFNELKLNDKGGAPTATAASASSDFVEMSEFANKLKAILNGSKPDFTRIQSEINGRGEERLRNEEYLFLKKDILKKFVYSDLEALITASKKEGVEQPYQVENLSSYLFALSRLASVSDGEEANSDLFKILKEYPGWKPKEGGEAKAQSSEASSFSKMSSVPTQTGQGDETAGEEESMDEFLRRKFIIPDGDDDKKEFIDYLKGQIEKQNIDKSGLEKVSPLTLWAEYEGLDLNKDLSSITFPIEIKSGQAEFKDNLKLVDRSRAGSSLLLLIKVEINSLKNNQKINKDSINRILGLYNRFGAVSSEQQAEFVGRIQALTNNEQILNELVDLEKTVNLQVREMLLKQNAARMVNEVLGKNLSQLNADNFSYKELNYLRFRAEQLLRPIYLDPNRLSSLERGLSPIDFLEINNIFKILGSKENVGILINQDKFLAGIKSQSQIDDLLEAVKKEQVSEDKKYEVLRDPVARVLAEKLGIKTEELTNKKGGTRETAAFEEFKNSLNLQPKDLRERRKFEKMLENQSSEGFKALVLQQAANGLFDGRSIDLGGFLEGEVSTNIRQVAFGQGDVKEALTEKELESKEWQTYQFRSMPLVSRNRILPLWKSLYADVHGKLFERYAKRGQGFPLAEVEDETLRRHLLEVVPDNDFDYTNPLYMQNLRANAQVRKFADKLNLGKNANALEKLKSLDKEAFKKELRDELFKAGSTGAEINLSNNKKQELASFLYPVLQKKGLQRILNLSVAESDPKLGYLNAYISSFVGDQSTALANNKSVDKFLDEIIENIDDDNFGKIRGLFLEEPIIKIGDQNYSLDSLKQYLSENSDLSQVISGYEPTSLDFVREHYYQNESTEKASQFFKLDEAMKNDNSQGLQSETDKIRGYVANVGIEQLTNLVARRLTEGFSLNANGQVMFGKDTQDYKYLFVKIKSGLLDSSFLAGKDNRSKLFELENLRTKLEFIDREKAKDENTYKQSTANQFNQFIAGIRGENLKEGRDLQLAKSSDKYGQNFVDKLLWRDDSTIVSDFIRREQEQVIEKTTTKSVSQEAGFYFVPFMQVKDLIASEKYPNDQVAIEAGDSSINVFNENLNGFSDEYLSLLKSNYENISQTVKEGGSLTVESLKNKFGNLNYEQAQSMISFYNFVHKQFNGDVGQAVLDLSNRLVFLKNYEGMAKSFQDAAVSQKLKNELDSLIEISKVKDFSKEFKGVELLRDVAAKFEKETRPDDNLVKKAANVLSRAEVVAPASSRPPTPIRPSTASIRPSTASIRPPTPIRPSTASGTPTARRRLPTR